MELYRVSHRPFFFFVYPFPFPGGLPFPVLFLHVVMRPVAAHAQQIGPWLARRPDSRAGTIASVPASALVLDKLRTDG